jgi:phage gp29-like protein
LQSLTLERLAAILNDLKRGECPAEYLELAQDIELKDLHYRSVLSTRKDAVTGYLVYRHHFRSKRFRVW